MRFLQPDLMTSLQPAAWHDLFVAIAGAAAALTGLLFVAVSINLKQILDIPSLPTRAAETLSVVLGLLLLSVFMLVPGQSQAVLGTEILALGLVIAAILLTRRLRLPRGQDDPLIWTVTPIAVIVAATVPMVAAGISVLAGAGGGLYWLVAAVILGFVGAILNAWILLVEIVR
jgi:modulator of FtsH protease